MRDAGPVPSSSIAIDEPSNERGAINMGPDSSPGISLRDYPLETGSHKIWGIDPKWSVSLRFPHATGAGYLHGR
jgi:hypothetical protein